MILASPVAKASQSASNGRIVIEIMRRRSVHAVVWTCPDKPARIRTSRIRIQGMHVATQFSVFVINKPGVLAAVAGALSAAKVNMTALSLMDSGDHGMLRMVCSDPDKARSVLSAAHDRWTETQVLVLELGNTPGAFAAVPRNSPTRRSTSPTPTPRPARPTPRPRPSSRSMTRQDHGHPATGRVLNVSRRQL